MTVRQMADGETQMADGSAGCICRLRIQVDGAGPLVRVASSLALECESDQPREDADGDRKKKSHDDVSLHSATILGQPTGHQRPTSRANVAHPMVVFARSNPWPSPGGRWRNPDGRTIRSRWQRTADGKRRWQTAGILPSGIVPHQWLGAVGRWQAGFGPVPCLLRMRPIFQWFSRRADGTAEAIPTG